MNKLQIFVVMLFAVFFALNNTLFVYYRGETSDHFNGKTFYNPNVDNRKTLYDMIKWRWTSERHAWPKHVEVSRDEMPSAKIDSGLKATYIGHATILLQLDGVNIITDPVFSSNAGPFASTGPRRVVDAGIELDKLPKIDYILLSHNHYDHMDAKTLDYLIKRDAPLIITPLGNDVVVKRFINKKANTIALDWYNSHILNEKVTVHCWPAQHWSTRFTVDRNRALWSGFVINTSQGAIYFAGDTGYDPAIAKDLIDTFKNVKLAFLPIGAYKPRWFMKDNHINPEEAVEIYKILGEPLSVAMHYGVFQLTDENYDEPPHALGEALDKHAANKEKFKLLKPGEHVEIIN